MLCPVLIEKGSPAEPVIWFLASGPILPCIDGGEFRTYIGCASYVVIGYDLFMYKYFIAFGSSVDKIWGIRCTSLRYHSHSLTTHDHTSMRKSRSSYACLATCSWFATALLYARRAAKGLAHYYRSITIIHTKRVHYRTAVTKALLLAARGLLLRLALSTAAAFRRSPVLCCWRSATTNKTQTRLYRHVPVYKTATSIAVFPRQANHL